MQRFDSLHRADSFMQFGTIAKAASEVLANRCKRRGRARGWRGNVTVGLGGACG
jgi:hypothetical protein